MIMHLVAAHHRNVSSHISGGLKCDIQLSAGPCSLHGWREILSLVSAGFCWLQALAHGQIIAISTSVVPVPPLPPVSLIRTFDPEFRTQLDKFR